MAFAARLIRADFKDKGRTHAFDLSEETSDRARVGKLALNSLYAKRILSAISAQIVLPAASIKRKL